MNAFVVLNIVLVIDLYVSIRDGQKHLVEAKIGKKIGYPFRDKEFDGLPFLHERPRRSLETLLKKRLSEFHGAVAAVSPESHFVRIPEDFSFTSHSSQQGQNLESPDSDIQPRKHIRRKSKKLTIGELEPTKKLTIEELQPTKKLTIEELQPTKKRRTNRKGKKKRMHKKIVIHRDNSTTAKGQPFDIVVHIKVNET